MSSSGSESNNYNPFAEIENASVQVEVRVEGVFVGSVILGVNGRIEGQLDASYVNDLKRVLGTRYASNGLTIIPD